MTATSHPLLHEAFETISHDSGFGAGHEGYSVPPEWADRLAEAEAALGTLDRIDFEVFCIGDADEMEEICLRSPQLERAHALLGSFFEDWGIDPS